MGEVLGYGWQSRYLDFNFNGLMILIAYYLQKKKAITVSNVRGYPVGFV